LPEPSPQDPADEPVLKRVDAWWTVLLIDPLAVWLVRVLGRAPAVTATHLTVVAHLMGLATAAMFAAGWLVPAAVIFEIRFVLDCADGKLARARGTSSAAGAFLDYTGDYLVVGANVVALALHLSWEGHLPALAAVGLPAAFMAHIAAGKSRLIEATADGAFRPHNERTPQRYRAWMAQRRLRPLPSRIEVEHVLLFVAPLVAVLADAPGLLAGAAWGAAAYFAYRTLRMTVGGYRLAAARDAAGRAPVASR
jgi:phosphatidylglycerophosphate synthase